MATALTGNNPKSNCTSAPSRHWHEIHFQMVALYTAWCNFAQRLWDMGDIVEWIEDREADFKQISSGQSEGVAL
jgi:hypothetical protein